MMRESIEIGVQSIPAAEYSCKIAYIHGRYDARMDDAIDRYFVLRAQEKLTK